ncbi:hypothetical protein D5086_018373 [Populus alba]|uniref:Uncharacterized protein n=1 Tax=Populus alba TaxID=43335 RepID=A0ACC4BPJ1_POPAL
MDSSSNEIIHQWGSYIRVYKDGRVERVGSPFCATYHNYVTSLVTAASVVAVSIDYRLAPEYLVPTCHEDSWVALKWVASHSNGEGPEEWIRDCAHFGQVFLAGDSGGANIAHDLAARAGIENLNGVKLTGLCLVHPYFGSKDSVDESWIFVSPTTSGLDDFRYNPAADSRMASLGCTRVLICLAEKDVLRQRGLFYYETLRKSGWGGEASFHSIDRGCRGDANGEEFDGVSVQEQHDQSKNNGDTAIESDEGRSMCEGSGGCDGWRMAGLIVPGGVWSGFCL